MNNNSQESLTTTDMSSQTQGTQNQNQNLTKYLGPAFIVALITATLYLIGYEYYVSFFTRLALPDRALDFPTAIYLRQAFLQCLFFFGVAFVSFYGANKKPNTFVNALRGNLFVLFFPLVYIIYLFRTGDSLIGWVSSVTFLFFLGSMIIGSYRHKSMAHSVYKSSWLKKALFLFMFIFIVSALAILMGDIQAESLIKGKLHKSLTISINLRNGKKFMPNKVLMLIMHYNGKYYMVEKNADPPKYSTVYILSDSEVELAKIDRVR